MKSLHDRKRELQEAIRDFNQEKLVKVIKSRAQLRRIERQLAEIDHAKMAEFRGESLEDGDIKNDN